MAQDIEGRPGVRTAAATSRPALVADRVAMGVRAGQKAFTLHGAPGSSARRRGGGVVRAAGFSLHAGIGIEAQARGKLERLCRYVSRPAVAEERSRHP